MTGWPFAPLTPGSYEILVADPPWSFELRSARGYDKSPESKYRTMSTDAVKALPVMDLADPPALLFLWTTWPMLAAGIAHGVMEAWGFRCVTGGSWAKRTASGKLAFGTGFVIRSASEPFLIGSVGKKARRLTTMRNHIDGAIGEHSEKPKEFYAELARATPGARRCDLFSAGRIRPGFEGWGAAHG